MQRGYFNMERNRLTTSHNQPPQAPPKEGMCSPKRFFLSKRSLSPNPNYSLTPDPSPNGEGSENHCLQIKESLSPNPSPNGEGSENYCLQMKESLSPNPSPNGEGSENHCLQMKGVFL